MPHFKILYFHGYCGDFIFEPNFSSDGSYELNFYSQSDDKKKSSSDWGMTKHAAAVLGIGLISMGEEIGSEMAFRTFGHLVR